RQYIPIRRNGSLPAVLLCKAGRWSAVAIAADRKKISKRLDPTPPRCAPPQSYACKITQNPLIPDSPRGGQWSAVFPGRPHRGFVLLEQEKHQFCRSEHELGSSGRKVETIQRSGQGEVGQANRRRPRRDKWPAPAAYWQDSATLRHRP